MESRTLFSGLFQGDHDDSESSAELVAVFSTPDKAKAFMELLSDQHTSLKREQRDRRDARLNYESVPNLYWDVRPIAFDPRSEEEL